METFAINDQLMNIRDNLYNFAYKLTSNRDDAQDLFQDTFLKVMECSSMYTENQNFKGWVFTIMRNLFINNYRRQSRMSHIEQAEDEDNFRLAMVRDDEKNEPDRLYAASEITEAINSFSDIYREPLKMYVAGFKYNEIAEKMDIPVGTIKSRIFVARQKLQTLFADC